MSHRHYAPSVSQPEIIKPTNPTSTPRTGTGDPSRKTSSGYDANFENHLVAFGIRFPDLTRKRLPHLHCVYASLTTQHPSLNDFSEADFDRFLVNQSQSKSEGHVSQYVVPVITGSLDPDHPCLVDTLFNNFAPLTDGSLIFAKPDICYGSRPHELPDDISYDPQLFQYIVPTKSWSRLILPNFFLEIKGPMGHLQVATRQICYDGALGARAIHALQNYMSEAPVYDGHAYTFGAIYQEGNLRLYAHYITAPTTSRGRPQYHMERVWSNDITVSQEECVRGITAFRNLRDLAKQYRDRFIQQAIAKAPRGNAQLPTTTDRVVQVLVAATVAAKNANTKGDANTNDVIAAVTAAATVAAKAANDAKAAINTNLDPAASSAALATAVAINAAVMAVDAAMPSANSANAPITPCDAGVPNVPGAIDVPNACATDVPNDCAADVPDTPCTTDVPVVPGAAEVSNTACPIDVFNTACVNTSSADALPSNALPSNALPSNTLSADTPSANASITKDTLNAPNVNTDNAVNSAHSTGASNHILDKTSGSTSSLNVRVLLVVEMMESKSSGNKSSIYNEELNLK